MKHREKFNNTWFYSPAHLPLRLLGIYVKGDILVIIPFFIFLAALALWSLKISALILSIYFVIRSSGEMIYWFSHQFWIKKYRPYDFGLKNLGNDAIYILYQLISTISAVIATSILILLIIYWRQIPT